MRQCFGFITIAFIAVTKVALGQTLPDATQAPAANALATDQPVCFLQTADGRIWNLSWLCGKVPVQPEIHQTSHQYHHH